MRDGTAGTISLFLLIAALTCTAAGAEDDNGKILRPADHSSFAAGPVDVVATAPPGKLLLDGKPVEMQQPFPDVFHGELKVSPGEHLLRLTWEGGSKEVRFFAGPNPPSGFEPFHQHPPVPGVQCTQCHALSKRGHFMFKGGCFDCHQRENFTKVHTHDPGVLEQCGMCHNAHGSVVKAHLLYPKEKACKICHS